MIELACRDAACAPPPVGSGGSKPGGSEIRWAANSKSVGRWDGTVPVFPRPVLKWIAETGGPYARLLEDGGVPPDVRDFVEYRMKPLAEELLGYSEGSEWGPYAAQLWSGMTTTLEARRALSLALHDGPSKDEVAYYRFIHEAYLEKSQQLADEVKAIGFDSVDYSHMDEYEYASRQSDGSDPFDPNNYWKSRAQRPDDLGTGMTSWYARVPAVSEKFSPGIEHSERGGTNYFMGWIPKADVLGRFGDSPDELLVGRPGLVAEFLSGNYVPADRPIRSRSIGNVPTSRLRRRLAVVNEMVQRAPEKTVPGGRRGFVERAAEKTRIEAELQVRGEPVEVERDRGVGAFGMEAGLDSGGSVELAGCQSADCAPPPVGTGGSRGSGGGGRLVEVPESHDLRRRGDLWNMVPVLPDDLVEWARSGANLHDLRGRDTGETARRKVVEAVEAEDWADAWYWLTRTGPARMALSRAIHEGPSAEERKLYRLVHENYLQESERMYPGHGDLQPVQRLTEKDGQPFGANPRFKRRGQNPDSSGSGATSWEAMDYDEPYGKPVRPTRGHPTGQYWTGDVSKSQVLGRFGDTENELIVFESPEALNRFLGRDEFAATSMLEFRGCQSPECAPPPVGTGGSRPGGGAAGFRDAVAEPVKPHERVVEMVEDVRSGAAGVAGVETAAQWLRTRSMALGWEGLTGVRDSRSATRVEHRLLSEVVPLAEGDVRPGTPESEALVERVKEMFPNAKVGHFADVHAESVEKVLAGASFFPESVRAEVKGFALGHTENGNHLAAFGGSVERDAPRSTLWFSERALHPPKGHANPDGIGSVQMAEPEFRHSVVVAHEMGHVVHAIAAAKRRQASHAVYIDKDPDVPEAETTKYGATSPGERVAESFGLAALKGYSKLTPDQQAVIQYVLDGAGLRREDVEGLRFGEEGEGLLEEWVRENDYYHGDSFVLDDDDELEFGCEDASCAPPPVGTGGSKPSGRGRVPSSWLGDSMSPDRSQRGKWLDDGSLIRQWAVNITGVGETPIGSGRHMTPQEVVVHEDRPHRDTINKRLASDAATFLRYVRDSPPSDGPLWRGVRVGDDFTPPEVGTTIDIPLGHFTRTKSTAMRMASYGPTYSVKQANRQRVVLHVAPGARGAHISRAGLLDEHEVVSGGRFVVTGLNRRQAADGSVDWEVSVSQTAVFDPDDQSTVELGYNPNQPRDGKGRWTEVPWGRVDKAQMERAVAAEPSDVDWREISDTTMGSSDGDPDDEFKHLYSSRWDSDPEWRKLSDYVESFDAFMRDSEGAALADAYAMARSAYDGYYDKPEEWFPTGRYDGHSQYVWENARHVVSATLKSSDPDPHVVEWILGVHEMTQQSFGKKKVARLWRSNETEEKVWGGQRGNYWGGALRSGDETSTSQVLSWTNSRREGAKWGPAMVEAYVPVQQILMREGSITGEFLVDMTGGSVIERLMKGEFPASEG